MDEIVTLHDESVWGVRDHIRDVEKVCFQLKAKGTY